MIHFGRAFARGALIAAAALSVVPASGVAAAGKGASYTVQISQMRYGSVPDNLKAGDTIVWVNKDTVPHTVTAKDHSFDIRIQPGQRVPLILAKPGTFAFYCVLHPTMRGALKVAE